MVRVEFGQMGVDLGVRSPQCASFCFGLMLYVWAIAAPQESSTPSSPDNNFKVRAGGHDPLASFLTICSSRRIGRSATHPPAIYSRTWRGERDSSGGVPAVAATAPPKRSWRIAVAALGAVLLAASAVFYFWRRAHAAPSDR